MVAVECYVTSKGVIMNSEALVFRLGGRAAMNKLLSALTVTEIPQLGRPKCAPIKRRAYYTAYLCAQEGLPQKAQVPTMCYVFPRATLPVLARFAQRTVVDSAIKNAWGSAPRFNTASDAPTIPLYSYQKAAIEFTCAGSPRHQYMQMGTGLGKTRYAIAAAVRNGGSTFVVVPTKAIREQWLEEIASLFPTLRRTVYDNAHIQCRKPAVSAETYDFVIGIINTVRTQAEGFFSGYTTVIFDEAHELSSPVNLKALWLTQEVPWVLGISATPIERPDGLDRIVCHFLGKPIIAEKDIPNFDIGAVNFCGRVREVNYSASPEYCETVLTSAGTVSAIGTVGLIVSDPERLSLVASEVSRAYNLHNTATNPNSLGLGLAPCGQVRTHGVFVFAEHRAYLPALRIELLKHFNSDEIAVPELEDNVIQEDNPELQKVATLRGGATNEDMNQARKTRIVLTTYGYSRRGVSLVDMTTIVLASPRRNGMRQILGRITRRGSDESIVRLVIDIRDVRTALKGQSSDRRSIYKEKNYPIFQVTAGDLCDPSEERLVWSPLL
jgi:hypothetical protein